MDPDNIMAFSFFSAYFNVLLILICFHKCHVSYSLKVVPTPYLSRVLHAKSRTHWFYRPYSSWGQKCHAHLGDLILRVFDCIVTTLCSVYIVLSLFLLVLYCVGVCMFGFCNVWVCVGDLVIYVLVFTVFCIVLFMYIYSYLFCLY